jgi:hypothetical protein
MIHWRFPKIKKPWIELHRRLETIASYAFGFPKTVTNLEIFQVSSVRVSRLSVTLPEQHFCYVFALALR